MRNRYFIFVVLFAVFGIASASSSVKRTVQTQHVPVQTSPQEQSETVIREPQEDKDVGPGIFFYEAYEQAPWRLAQSPLVLAKKCVILLFACGILFLYLRFRKSKT